CVNGCSPNSGQGQRIESLLQARTKRGHRDHAFSDGHRRSTAPSAPPRAQTRAVFQRPRLNSHSVNRPTAVSETSTPQNTPECAQPKGSASTHASGIWISQKNTRLIHVGVIVSPAPLKACTDTIHQPDTK